MRSTFKSASDFGVLLYDGLTVHNAILRAICNASLFLQITKRPLGSSPHMFVTVIGESLESTDGSGRRREPQRLDRRRPQPRRLPAEQSAARLREFDQPLTRPRAADPPQGQHQFTRDRFVLLFLHSGHERHGERRRLAATHADRRLDPDLRRLVAQRAPQRLCCRARADLRECERDGFAHPLILVVQLRSQRRHRLLEAELSRQLGDVADNKPLVVPEHVHKLVSPFLHTGQRDEDGPPLLDRRGGDEQIETHFDAGLARPAHGAGASNKKLCIVTPMRFALPLSRVARSSSPACSASPRSSSNSSASGGSAGIVISWMECRSSRCSSVFPLTGAPLTVIRPSCARMIAPSDLSKLASARNCAFCSSLAAGSRNSSSVRENCAANSCGAAMEAKI